ncbi:hypothetical protein DH2020_003969 [Rehmannia glutinosa]|uniref:DUF4378 domain-containing protein n=1 Tax=Rehmannia glutinosa TaxID=99300 RepID=A0ABR0XNG4_REHGL
MPKLLAQFLQEQQEPFALEVYLLERGYSKGTTRDAASTNSRFFKAKRRYVDVPHCSEFVKAVFGRHSNRKISKNHGIAGRKCNFPKNRGSVEGHADEDEFSCSESDANGNIFSEEKVDAERKLKWRINMEDGNKQLSPVSVLEETESDQGSSPVHHNECNLKTTQGETSTSIISQHKPKEPTHELTSCPNNPYDQYMINKRALQQKKQLLIDCVREVIENHRKKDDKKGQQLKKILGTEELWKLVCENVWLWSQNSIHETNIFHLLNYDFMASVEEWINDFEMQKEGILMEIGDDILEGILSEIFIS